MNIELINPYIRFALKYSLTEQAEPYVAYDQHLYYIWEGEGSVEFLGTSYRFTPKSLIFIPSGVAYRFVIPRKIHLTSINFDFTKSNCDKKTPIHPVPPREFHSAGIYEPWGSDACAELTAPFVLENAGELSGRLDFLLSEYSGSRGYSSELAASELKSVIMLALRYRATGVGADEKVSAMIRYVEENLAGNVSNTELSSIFGYHPYHVNRLFKDSLGITLHQYLIEKRIERAKDLLRDTNVPISDIAAALGYGGPSDFSRAFKKRMGMTPGAYRRSSRIVY